jgi:hypothetical protein
MCNTPRVGLASLPLPSTASFTSPAPLPGRSPAVSSVSSASSQLRSDVRSTLSTRSASHAAQANQAMEQARRAREQAREAREQHALAGLDEGSMTNASLNGSAYPYAARGAQLASLARQGQRPRRAQASQGSMGRADDGDDLVEGISMATGGLRQAHERETAAQALRRTQAQARLHRDTLGEEEEEEDPSIPELDPPSATWQNSEASREMTSHMRQLQSVHARVGSLQRQIDGELQAIQRTRNPRVVPDDEERKYPVSVPYQDPNELSSAGASSDEDSWPNPSAALSLTRPPPPPRPAPAAAQANFSPYVSAAERLRGEVDGIDTEPSAANRGSIQSRLAAVRSRSSIGQMSPLSAASSRPSAASPGSIQVGSLSVRVERAEALRTEMAFLSSLFDNVRSYQTNLVQNLHAAGFVDDSAMAQLPGLHVGLIHFLIESAWGAAARAGGLEGAAAAFGNIPTGPILPPGHAERVDALPTVMLQVAAADDCCVCLDSMPAGAAVSKLANCTHTFHSTCIKEWLSRANTCPLCKRTAIEDPAADAAPAAKASVGSQATAAEIEVED